MKEVPEHNELVDKDNDEHESSSEFLVDLENKELNESEFLEYSRKIGDYYKDFLKALITGQVIPKLVIDGLPSHCKKILRSLRENTVDSQEKFELIQKNREMTAEDFLSQAVSSDKKDFFNQESAYRLEELNKGIYGIFLDRNLFEALWPDMGAQAMAVKLKRDSGVPFVIIPEYNDHESPDAKKNFEENIPHEVNHLVWFFSEEKGDLPVEEDHHELTKAFLVFREEFVCRVSTGGNVGGYTHINKDRSYAERLKQTDLEVYNTIVEKSDTTQNLCRDIGALLGQTEAFERSDLIMTALEATNFSDFIAGLEKWKKILENFPKPKIVKNSTDFGWDAV